MATSHSSRLKVGIDVPWVTSWSTEAIGTIGACATVGGALAVLQGESPETGRPIYSKNHFRRQRLSVQQMLCPMCGRPTASGDRWSQTGKHMTAGAMRARGLANSIPAATADDRVILDAGAIAPGHLACMARSLEFCPHLRTLDDRELKPFPAEWQVTPMLMKAVVRRRPPGGTAAGGAGTEAETVVAIGFLQLCGITDRVDAAWPASAASRPA
ncbi:MAG: hypothetical protein ACRYG4_08055 [Janthinobacterium lividum]